MDASVKPKGKSVQFLDSPTPAQLAAAVSGWHVPDLPPSLSGRRKIGYSRTGEWYLRILEASENGDPASARKIARDESARSLIDWLYRFIRLNIKRGRIFDLREVLQTGEADCLGYAKLFTSLGRRCGLDLGPVEVVTDNRGCNVPHTVTLVKLPSRKIQFVDFWYGSTAIRHKRLGLQVLRTSGWQSGDLDIGDISRALAVTYLTDRQVDAITLYIQGNRGLKQNDFPTAIRLYTRALRLYSHNTRVNFNRGIAYEKLAQTGKAAHDYDLALSETALTRTLATQPPEVINLINLDRQFIPELDQQIYLLRRGFMTGRPVSAARIAAKLGLLPSDVESILSLIGNLAE